MQRGRRRAQFWPRTWEVEFEPLVGCDGAATGTLGRETAAWRVMRADEDGRVTQATSLRRVGPARLVGIAVALRARAGAARRPWVRPARGSHGLALTALSSVIQPAFGVLTDRRNLFWLVPVGLGVAGVGIALSGVMASYPLTFLAVALGGTGVAAFHREAARAARMAAGDSQEAMSGFLVGGNIGYALGPLAVVAVFLLAGRPLDRLLRDHVARRPLRRNRPARRQVHRGAGAHHLPRFGGGWDGHRRPPRRALKKWICEWVGTSAA